MSSTVRRKSGKSRRSGRRERKNYKEGQRDEKWKEKKSVE